MAWSPAPACVAILNDANRVAPYRNRASDGILGDAFHAASLSDHNPDGNGIVHAVDVTNDPARGMNTWYWANVIAGRILTGQERRVKYLVSNNGTEDVIFNPEISLTWRPNLDRNGYRQHDHANHLHTSVLYTSVAENDTSRYFVSAAPPAPPEDEVEHGQAVDIALNPANPAQGYILDRWGGIHSLGLAPRAVGTGYWPNKDVARKLVVTNWTKPAGYVMDLFGGTHPFGAAPALKNGPWWKGGKIVPFNEV